MTRAPEGPGVATLWLPLVAPGATVVAALAVLAFHVSTMARDLSPYDSAELALAAVQPGLSHPIGQPLHTLLGWLVTRLPGVPRLLGLNLLSALPLALALLPVVSLAEGMLPAGGARPARAPARWIIPASVALALLHPALWEPATRVEVYALATFLSLWGVARVAALLGSASPAPRAAAGAGLAFGLAASSHAFVATIAALAVAPALVGALARRRLSPGGLGALLAAGLAGLAPYAWLPLAARRPGAFCWGAPRDLASLTRYLSGADYAHNGGITVGELLRHLAAFAAHATSRGLLPLVAAGLAGHLLLGRRAPLGRAAAPLALALALLLVCANRIFYVEVLDYLGYLAAPLLLGVAGAAAGAVALAATVPAGARARLRTAGLGAAAALVTASILLASPSPWARTRRLDRLARLLAEGALAEAPQGAVVIVAADHWAFPLLYVQEAEGRRPDLVVLVEGLTGGSWYWEHLYQRHPDLRPFALRGPGGRPARLRRFLDAHAERAVLVESGPLLSSLGLGGCPGGWMLRAARACPPGPPPDGGPSGALERAAASLGRGAPGADEVLAAVAVARGEMYWRTGWGAAALRALRAGVPPAELPPLDRAAAAAATAAPPLARPLPRWRRPAPIGDAARALFLAGWLLLDGGDADGAADHVAAARALGLPEAQGER